MNPHIEEWKNIKQWYQSEHEQTPEIRFRVECIDELLKQENDKELAHFR